LPLLGSDCGGGLSSRSVEQHAAAKDLVGGGIKGVTKLIASAARGQKGHAETDFEDCDGRRPD
jgi:hypothetical protein